MVETAISLGVFAVLVGSVFQITVESSSFLEDIDADASVQAEGHRAFTRLGDILRKSGRVVDVATTYPRVTEGGSALEFRVGADLDGNGYAFDADSAELEWDERVFVIRADPDRNLGVYLEGDEVYRLGRFVESLRFETIEENNALHLKEVRVIFETRRPLPSGGDVIFPVQGSVHMRN